MSQLLGRTAWWVKNDAEAQDLVDAGFAPGNIYTEWERRLLWELRDNPDLISKADEVKGLFYGTIIGRI